MSKHVKQTIAKSRQPSLKPNNSEKIQKVLARAGLGSRRQLETWLSEGRISVDGKVAKLGDRVGPKAKLRVDGHLVKLHAATDLKTRILLYHKPEGEICTRSDPEGRATVFERLPLLRGQRWVVIGRLDINTSGLLLFTNNGELAHRLMHPSHQIEREYAVRVRGQVTAEILQRLQHEVMLDDGPAAFTHIQDAGGEGSNHWYHATLNEGRNREVKRLWESQGLVVSRLIRIRFATLLLPRHLRAGRWEEMNARDVAVFIKSLDTSCE